MSVYMTEAQRRMAAQRQEEVSRAEYERRAAEKRAAPVTPLPYPYWKLGTEVPGAQPYVSGKVSEPVAVAPAGYVVSEVKEVTVGPKPPMTVQQALQPPPSEKQLEVTFKPKTYEVPTSLFGIKEYEWDPKTGILTHVVYTKAGERIKVPTRMATMEEIWAGKATLGPHEQSALLGLGLTTTVAMGVAVPKLGAFALGGVSVAEVGKFTIYREHLTVPEAISAAGMGELVGLGLMGAATMAKPKVEKSLEASYRQAVEEGYVWKPSLVQKVGMKVTGAQPTRLAQEIVGAGEPKPVTLEMLKKGVTSPEEAYFWDIPTPKSAQVYLRSPEPRVKAWAVGTLVKRVYLEGLFTTTLRTGLITETEKMVKPEMPFIPKEPYITKVQQVTPLATTTGLMLTSLAVPKQVAIATAITPKTIQRTMTREALRQETMQPLIVGQVLGLKQMQKQSQRQAQVLAQQLAQTQTQSQVQLQRQAQQQAQAFAMPMITKMGQLPFYKFPSGFDMGGFLKASARRTGLWGRYPRVYPVVTGAQFLEMEYGQKKRRKKK